MTKDKTKPISEGERKAMLEEYFAKGRTVTRCPPGPSEGIVYKNTYGKRQSGARRKTAPADAEPKQEQKAE